MSTDQRWAGSDFSNSREMLAKSELSGALFVALTEKQPSVFILQFLSLLFYTWYTFLIQFNNWWCSKLVYLYTYRHVKDPFLTGFLIVKTKRYKTNGGIEIL